MLRSSKLLAILLASAALETGRVGEIGLKASDKAPNSIVSKETIVFCSINDNRWFSQSLSGSTGLIIYPSQNVAA
jgi:hypothetical protein